MLETLIVGAVLFAVGVVVVMFIHDLNNSHRDLW